MGSNRRRDPLEWMLDIVLAAIIVGAILLFATRRILGL